MGDWRQIYKDKLITMEEAAEKVEAGDTFYLGPSWVIPYAWLDVLYENKEKYRDVGFWYNVMTHPTNMIFDESIRDHFRLMNIFNLPLDRMAISEKTIEVLGATYDTILASCWENGVNAYACNFLPPDEDGYCNVSLYGNSTAAEVLKEKEGRIKKKIAFINKTGIFPVKGERETSAIHVSEFDYIVEHDTEPREIPAAQPTEHDAKIANFILPYLRPNDKVQIGFGGLGEYILSQLDNLPFSIEVYTEVFCDSMIPLMESGKITKLRAASPGACTVENCAWTVTTDKDFLLRPRYEMIEPLYLMQMENLVAINATFMVDLLGQACSEAQGLKPFSGMGGSFAYIYGALRAPGGRSFLCLRSTYTDKAGQLQSNIVPWLPEGSIVSMLKSYVMFIVSDYGVADVYLKTYTARIKAIIKIAHPEFRPWLKEKILTTTLIHERDFKDYDINDSTPPAPRQPYNMTIPPQLKNDFKK